MNLYFFKSLFCQTGILTRRYTRIILHDKKKLRMVIIFPLVLALVIVWVAGKGMFDTFEQTQACLFMIVSSTIFVGLCNTIQEICKERSIVKREYMANLNLASYIISKMLVQGAISVISTIISMTVYGIAFDFPKKGIISGSSFFDFFVSILLLMLASNAMGILVSSVVKNNDAANTIAPYLLIVQVVFSGVLFDMEGFMDVIASLMVSKWGMAELGSVCRLNDLPSKVNIPGYTIEAKDIYMSTQGHLSTVWLILITVLILCSVIGAVVLRRVAKDVR